MIWVFFGLKSNNRCWQYSLLIAVAGFGKGSLTVKHFFVVVAMLETICEINCFNGSNYWDI